MKKIAIILGIAVSILIVLWYVGRFTNSLALYNVPSEANEPTIKVNSKIWISRFKKPKRFDFIVVRAVLEKMGKSTVVFRLCGLPGDVIEIRDGQLYVNNKAVDGQFDLMIRYTLPSSEYPKIQDSVDINSVIGTGDSMSTFLSSKFVQRRKLIAKQHVIDKEYEDVGIKNQYGHNWNQDHFGPITIPPGHYFILGDNRLGAQDSRYIGLIPDKDFVGTVLNR